MRTSAICSHDVRPADDQITGERERGTAVDRVPLECHDDRVRACAQRDVSCSDRRRGRWQPCRRWLRVVLRQVESRAERTTGATQQHHADPGIVAGRADGRSEFVEHRGNEGVLSLRAIELDDRHPITIRASDQRLVGGIRFGDRHQFLGRSEKGVFRSGPGSRGSPSTRSPRVFFWISSVPPPSDIPRQLRT